MKKIVLMLIMALAVTVAFGQKNVRTTAYNYLREGKLEKALEAINQCINDPTTAADAKTWYYRGTIFLEISNSTDETLRSAYPDAVKTALESYQKAVEFDTKKDMFEEIYGKVEFLRIKYFNAGVEFYNAKEFKPATDAFGKAASAYESISLVDTAALLYAGYSASAANDMASAKLYFDKLIKANYRSVGVYKGLAEMYKLEKDSAKAFAVLREGFKYFPGDYELFLEETNIYLAFNDTERALSNLKVAVQKDSTNFYIYNAIGNMYDRLYNDTTRSDEIHAMAEKEAVNAFSTAIRIKPDFYDAYLNLGAFYFNIAAPLMNKANQLPIDESALYEKLSKEAERYFRLAIPYLEKAISIDASDLTTLQSLRQAYTVLHEKEKLIKINEMIETQKHK
jgi:Tfp pilus assembly protein PilF